MKQPRERYLHWRRVQGYRRSVKHRRLQRTEASQRKERHIGDTSTCKIIDEAVVIPVRQVVEVLHTDNLCDRLRLCQLIATDVAKPEMTNQSLTLEIGKHRQ